MIRKNIIYFSFILWAAFLYSCNTSRPNYSTDTTTPVWLGDVQKRTIREITTTTGTAKASEMVEVKSEDLGKYLLQQNPKTGKPYKLGDMVEKGTVIVRLENPTAVNNISIETKKMDVTIAENEWKGQQRVFALGGATEKEVMNAERNFISAKIALEEAQKNLDKLAIKAPFKGVITKLPYYTPNIEVSAGQVMFELMDYSNMYMEIELPENVIDKINIGQKVFITNYNIKSDTLTGKVSQLSPAVNETTRTFSGFITIENPALKLRPGMFAKGDIITLQRDSVLAIPKDIVSSYRRSSLVYTVERNVAVEKILTLGISDDHYVEVVNGLSEGDKIVIRGHNYLRSRSAVKVMK